VPRNTNALLIARNHYTRSRRLKTVVCSVRSQAHAAGSSTVLAAFRVSPPLAHPRFVLHFTPTSSSWLNLVERWFSELTTKKLQRSAHRSTRALNADIRAWNEHWNENPRPFVWTRTAEEILDTSTNYCKRINDSGH
jgi:transposase